MVGFFSFAGHPAFPAAHRPRCKRRLSRAESSAWLSPPSGQIPGWIGAKPAAMQWPTFSRRQGRLNPIYHYPSISLVWDIPRKKPVFTRKILTAYGLFVIINTLCSPRTCLKRSTMPNSVIDLFSYTEKSRSGLPSLAGLSRKSMKLIARPDAFRITTGPSPPKVNLSALLLKLYAFSYSLQWSIFGLSRLAFFKAVS